MTIHRRGYFLGAQVNLYFVLFLQIINHGFEKAGSFATGHRTVIKGERLHLWSKDGARNQTSFHFGLGIGIGR